MDITNEALAAALAGALDEDGNDVRLAAATAAMSAEERHASDENIRDWVRSFQAGMTP